jgi:hypothetical protein
MKVERQRAIARRWLMAHCARERNHRFYKKRASLLSLFAATHAAHGPGSYASIKVERDIHDFE